MLNIHLYSIPTDEIFAIWFLRQQGIFKSTLECFSQIETYLVLIYSANVKYFKMYSIPTFWILIHVRLDVFKKKKGYNWPCLCMVLRYIFVLNMSRLFTFHFFFILDQMIIKKAYKYTSTFHSKKSGKWLKVDTRHSQKKKERLK